MVPDTPSLTRRRVVGGLAGLVAGGTVTVGATAPTVLPDALTDAATRYYPTPPELSQFWRPTVTESHAEQAVSLLADVVARGKRLWSRTDADDDFRGAGGWLESSREDLRNGRYHEALFGATYGIQFAGEALGVARARLGRPEADLRNLADRTESLLARSRRVVDDVSPYPCVEPGRDLAWYYRIEREALLGRVDAAWHGYEAAADGESDELDDETYDARAVGSITAGILQAELRVRNAERYRDILKEKLDGDGDPYADHLAATAERFRSAIESFPSREAVESEYVDDDEYGPYEFAHSRLARWCYDTNYRFGSGHADDLRAYRAVELSSALARRRGHGFAVENLVVDEGDEGFDSGHTLAEKRRARKVYRSVVGSNPPPLLTRQVTRAVEDLQVAKVGFAGSYQRPLWRERLQAYLYALIGRAKLREYPSLYDAVVNRE